MVGAWGTASGHQGFRKESIAKVAPERRFWAIPIAPPSLLLLLTHLPPSPFRLHPLPPPLAPTGQAAADHVNTLMELIHHSPGGQLRSPQPGRPARPTPPGGRLWTHGPLGLGREQPVLFVQLNPVASLTEQCPQCGSAGSPRREAKAQPSQVPGAEGRGWKTQKRRPLPHQPADPVVGS